MDNWGNGEQAYTGASHHPWMNHNHGYGQWYLADPLWPALQIPSGQGSHYRYCNYACWKAGRLGPEGCNPRVNQ